MSHDETMRRVFGVTLRTVTERIVRVFDSATPSDLEAGARWYPQAGALAASLSSDKVSTEQAAAVIAALSPRTSWDRNVAGATAMINQGPTACLRIVFLTANVDRARTAKRKGLDGLGNGPKIDAFARNILGDVERVTVDVWAARVAGVDEEKLPRVGAYEAIAHAYRLAARRRGVDPSTMQATTWIVARGGRAS